MTSDMNQQAPDESGPKKPAQQILREEVSEGMESFRRPVIDLFISGLSAGLDIGFSLFLMAVIRTLLREAVPKPWLDFIVGNMYSAGFIIVVLGRSELFTEQTTLAVLPVLGGQASLGELARLWVVVFIANLVGGAVFAGMIIWIGPRLGIIDPSAFGDIARPLFEHPGVTIFLGALLAGWLMGLLSWLVAAAKDTISQIVIVWLITTMIGLGHLQHVVVGSIEVMAGIFSGQGVTLADFGTFLIWTTLGNVVGGSVFVALIKHGHAGGTPVRE